MIGIVIVAVLGIVEEVELQGIVQRSDALLHLRNGAESLDGIVTILRRIHHRGIIGNEGPPHPEFGIDTRCHRMSALGVDQDDAIGTTGTVEGGGILQHCHLVDILRRDGRQHIEDVALMQRQPALLHVELHTVEDDEGLCIGIDRTDTADKHCSALLKVAGMHVHANIATQLLGHLLIDGQSIAVGDETVLGRDGGAVLIHGREGIAEHRDTHLLGGIAGDDTYLLRHVLRRLHEEHGGEGGHLDGELTITIGHGSITVIVEGLQAYTGQGRLGGGIDHKTFHIDGRILIGNLGTLRCLEGRRGLLLIEIILRKSHWACYKECNQK